MTALTDEELQAARELADAAYREDSIAGLEMYHDKLRMLVPRLLDLVASLKAERDELSRKVSALEHAIESHVWEER